MLSDNTKETPCYELKEFLGEINKTWRVNVPTRKSPEGDPNNQDRETRSGGKNSPQALIVLLVRENKKVKIIIFSPRENQYTVRRFTGENGSKIPQRIIP